jgi:hypothetical protein
VEKEKIPRKNKQTFFSILLFFFKTDFLGQLMNEWQATYLGMEVSYDHKIKSFHYKSTTLKKIV